MNNIIVNFNQILDFSRQYNIPITKKRAILREFIQVKILDLIYEEKEALKLSFTGGTSLRLLKNLDRFSEDLDFDNLGLSNQRVGKLIQKVHQRLKKENISVDLYENVKQNKQYYEFRFKDLLYSLRISNLKAEKLMIKFDYSDFWQGQKTHPSLLNRYGFVFNLITNGLNQVLVQKLQAYVFRQQTQPRDVYDIVWLKAQGAQVDKQFIKINKLKTDLVQLAKEKFIREKKKLSNFKQRLKPFLINEDRVKKLDLFLQVLK